MTAADAGQYVKMEKNKVHNPVVSTAEVAEALEVSEETAYDLLSESPLTNEKAVGDSHVWW